MDVRAKFVAARVMSCRAKGGFESHNFTPSSTASTSTLCILPFNSRHQQKIDRKEEVFFSLLYWGIIFHLEEKRGAHLRKPVTAVQANSELKSLSNDNTGNPKQWAQERSSAPPKKPLRLQP